MDWLILNPTFVYTRVTCNMARVTLEPAAGFFVFAAAATDIIQVVDRKSSGLDTMIHQAI